MYGAIGNFPKDKSDKLDELSTVVAASLKATDSQDVPYAYVPYELPVDKIPQTLDTTMIYYGWHTTKDKLRANKGWSGPDGFGSNVLGYEMTNGLQSTAVKLTAKWFAKYSQHTINVNNLNTEIARLKDVKDYSKLDQKKLLVWHVFEPIVDPNGSQKGILNDPNTSVGRTFACEKWWFVDGVGVVAIFATETFTKNECFAAGDKQFAQDTFLALQEYSLKGTGWGFHSPESAAVVDYGDGKGEALMQFSNGYRWEYELRNGNLRSVKANVQVFSGAPNSSQYFITGSAQNGSPDAVESGGLIKDLFGDKLPNFQRYSLYIEDGHYWLQGWNQDINISSWVDGDLSSLLPKNPPIIQQVFSPLNKDEILAISTAWWDPGTLLVMGRNQRYWMIKRENGQVRWTSDYGLQYWGKDANAQDPRGASIGSPEMLATGIFNASKSAKHFLIGEGGYYWLQYVGIKYQTYTDKSITWK